MITVDITQRSRCIKFSRKILAAAATRFCHLWVTIIMRVTFSIRIREAGIFSKYYIRDLIWSQEISTPWRFLSELERARIKRKLRILKPLYSIGNSQVHTALCPLCSWRRPIKLYYTVLNQDFYKSCQIDVTVTKCREWNANASWHPGQQIKVRFHYTQPSIGVQLWVMQSIR